MNTTIEAPDMTITSLEQARAIPESYWESEAGKLRDAQIVRLERDRNATSEARAQKAVQDWVGTNREKVLAAIKREMEKRKSAIIQQFVDAASNAINPGFHVSCSIQPRESR